MTTSEQHPLEELDRIAEKAYVETIMRLHAHIVMDVNGDTRHTFNPESEVEAREAMKRFDDLLKTHIAARRLGEGRTELVRSFSVADEEVLFFRKLAGG